MTYIVTAQWTYVYAYPTTFSPVVGTVRRGMQIEGHEVNGATARGSPAWIQWAGGGYVRSGCVRAG